VGFTNKRVLITGADGFIGSHLTEMLARKAGKVRALAQYNSFNSWGWLEDTTVLSDIDVVTGDVRDPNFCNTITEGIDVVFHLAALIAIPYSYVAPDSYVDTNIRGTLNICQAAMRNGCTRVMHTSTSEVYGTAQYAPIDELHPLQPQSPYSASKIGADAMAMSFHNTFELPLTIARPFNTYGPRQSARAIIRRSLRVNVVSRSETCGRRETSISSPIPAKACWHWLTAITPLGRQSTSARARRSLLAICSR
jgi:nucleoside-diphosphate-sugar epimerase